jgi:hypothetical protein
MSNFRFPNLVLEKIKNCDHKKFYGLMTNLKKFIL